MEVYIPPDLDQIRANKKRTSSVEPSEKKEETVDHPTYYNQGGIEVIDAIESWGLGFSLGNVIKYVARAEHKGKQIEDLKKAQWYLNRQIEFLEGDRS